MPKWDILHVKSLEVERAVPEQKILQDIKDGRLSRDDCVRKPGDERWWRIYEVRQFREPVEEGADEPPRIETGSLRQMLADAEPSQVTSGGRTPRRVSAEAPQPSAGSGGMHLLGENPIAAVLDEPDEGLPYQRRHHEEQEELDMTPMVDVAMQLILFFMVTSSMIMQMCLDFPHPAPDDANRPIVKEQVQKVDELKTDHIMVKVKSDNGIYVDEEKQPTKDVDLTTKFESIKHARNPNGGIVIMADELAFHETVVKVVDAANLARVEPIKMANPQKQSKNAATKRKAIK